MRMIATLIVALSMSATAPAQDEASARSSAGSRLDALSARSGLLLVTNYTDVGGMGGETVGRIKVQAQEVRDTANPKVAQLGLAITIEEPGRAVRLSIAYVDDDEIDALIKGIDYLAKLTPGGTALRNVNGLYRTRGGFTVSVLDQNELVVSTGVPRAMVLMPVAGISRLRQLLWDGKAALDLQKQKR